MLVLKAKFILFRFQWQMIKSNNLDEFWKVNPQYQMNGKEQDAVQMNFTLPWDLIEGAKPCRWMSFQRTLLN